LHSLLLLRFLSSVFHDSVFRRVLSLLDPAAFQAAFADRLVALQARAAERTGVARPFYRVDGNTLRRSHTLSLLKQHPGGHSVSMKRQSCVWSDESLPQVLAGQRVSVRRP
jgi:hypothetical protein